MVNGSVLVSFRRESRINCYVFSYIWYYKCCEIYKKLKRNEDEICRWYLVVLLVGVLVIFIGIF